jgi:amidase
VIDLRTATATDAVAALANGTIGSEELLDAQLARVDAYNPAVNAVVAFDVDRARARARAADEAIAAGSSWGPLHGLPITIKDAFETEGLVTTSGAPELATHVPTVDADAVARLKAAGAIVFGKTNLPLYAGDVQSYNEVYGVTSNPWDLDRAPGGSSGGAAAALATGMTLLELGSDIGGSIRNPCHYCGVFGHKPTWGAVSDRGHIPGPPGALSAVDLNVAGPMGRSVADLELGMDVLVGDVGGVPGGTFSEVRPDLRDIGDLKVGVWLDDPFVPTDGAVLRVLEAAVAAIEGAGATVRADVRPVTSLEELTFLYLQLLLGVVGAGYPEEVHDLMGEVAAAAPPGDRSMATAMALGISQSHAGWMRVNEARTKVQREWVDVFGEVDVVLAPVTPVAAIPHDNERPMDQRTIVINGEPADYFTQIVWAGVATMPLLPATAVPAGRTEAGLPVGLQLIGPRYGDRLTLRAAAWLEQLLGGFEAPPGC